MTLFDALSGGFIIAFLALVFFWSNYNRFVAKLNQVREDFSDIDIQLKRRADLITKLAEVAKAYAKHEKTVLEHVAAYRMGNPEKISMQDIQTSQNHLRKTYNVILAISEKYPDLKANETFKDLMDNMKDTEDMIAEYREVYNQTVKKYNSFIQMFPNFIAARTFGFADAEFFSMREEML